MYVCGISTSIIYRKASVNILCLVWFGSSRNNLAQLLIQARNSGSWTVRSLLVCNTIDLSVSMPPENFYYFKKVKKTSSRHQHTFITICSTV